jgi:hypothetical protein
MTGRRGVWHAHPIDPPPPSYFQRFVSALALTVAAVLATIGGFLFVVWFLTLGPA